MTEEEFNKFVWDNARIYIGFENLTIEQIQSYFDSRASEIKKSIFDMNVALEEVRNCPDVELQKQIQDRHIYKQEAIENEKEEDKIKAAFDDQLKNWDCHGLDDFKKYMVSMHTNHYDYQNDFWLRKPTIEEERKQAIDFCLSDIAQYESALNTLKEQEIETMSFLNKLNSIIPETPVAETDESESIL